MSKLQTEQCKIDNCIDESIENSALCNISEFRPLSKDQVLQAINKATSKSCLLD